MLPNTLKVAIINSVMGKYLVYVVQFLSLMLYARLFSPEIFGTLAVIQVFVFMIQLIGDSGLESAIINKRNFKKSDISGVFSVIVISAFVLGFFGYACSYLISFIYDKQEYTKLGIFVAISILFNVLSIVPIALYKKNRHFLIISWGEVFSEILTFSILYLLLSNNIMNGLFCFALKFPIYSFLRFIFIYISSYNKDWGIILPGKKVKAIVPMLNYMKFQMGFNIINYVSRNLDTFLLGKIVGIQALGFYDQALKLSRYPLMLISSAMIPAIQPVIVEYRHDLKYIKNIHLQLSKKIGIIGSFIAAGIFVYSPEIVRIILGDQWNDVVSLLRIFSIGIIAQVLMFTSSFFQALERVELLFSIGYKLSIVYLFCIILGLLTKDINVLAASIVFALYINLIYANFVLYKKLLNSNFIDFLKVVSMTTFCFLLSLLAFFWMGELFNFIISPFFKMIAIGATTFISIFFILVIKKVRF